MYKLYILFLYSFLIIFTIKAYSQETEFIEHSENKKYSLLEEKIKSQDADLPYPDLMHLYKDTYFLPAYYTTYPHDELYKNSNPYHQPINNTEVKAQLSFFIPLATDLNSIPNFSMGITYTQIIFWQVYTSHPFIRETDYEPTFYLRYPLNSNVLLSVLFNHLSNGVGNKNEKSWNRLIGSIQTTLDNFLLEFNVWQTLDSRSYYLERYLGHASLNMSYKFQNVTLNTEIQNELESKFKYGKFLISATYPLHRKNLFMYAQYFNGYGQSILEFDHYTQGFGIGFSINNSIY